MEQKRISCCEDSVVVYDRLPPLSPKFPWFVAQNIEDEEIRDQIFYTIRHKPPNYRCQIPELVGRQIRAFFHGWLILSNHPHDLIWSLWNPTVTSSSSSSKMIHLPSLSLGNYHESCLSSPPDDPSSVFLLTTRDKPSLMVCQLAASSSSLRWTEISYADQLRSIINEQDGILHGLTCHNGKVYTLHTSGEHDSYVIHVDINIIMVNKEKQVAIRLFPFVELPDPSFCINPSLGAIHFLKGSSTELFYIEIDFEDKMRKTVSEVFLFKLDMTSIMWEEMEDLKDAVFFIELPNDYAIFYTPTIATEFGGYVHIVDVTGEVIYSYHIKDKTISVSSMSSLVGTTTKVSSWAMLEFRLEGDYGEAKCATDSKQEEIDKDKKTVVAVNEVESSESRLLDLPFHVLETVMKFCVVVEYMNFRATCKRCHLAAPSLQWSKKTTLTRLQTYSLLSPWLIVLEKHQMTLKDPKFGNHYFIKMPQELIGDWQWHIHCSRYGWLLLSDDEATLVFFNPLTSDIRKLPEAPHCRRCCFTEPPTSPDCMVIGLIYVLEWQVHIRFVGREPDGHRIVRLNVGGDNPYPFCFPTYHNGGMCALGGNEGKLYVYKDFDGEPLVVETPTSSFKSTKRYFQVKCEQDILLVIVGKFGESVEVFKLNDFTKGWEEIDGLGNHTIYICNSTCLCIEAKTPDMENKIYFPHLYTDGGDMVLYSLETRAFHTINGKKIGGLFGTTSHCYPHAWIEPSWS